VRFFFFFHMTWGDANEPSQCREVFPHHTHRPPSRPSLPLFPHNNSTSTVERATELLQDPRPPADKAPDALAAVAGDLASLVRRGAAAEAGVVSTLAARLPPDIRDALPPEFLSGSGGGAQSAGGGAASTTAQGADDPPPPTPAAASAARASAEATSLESAARRVREAANALVEAGAGPSAALLRLNLAEARAGLAGALGALGPGEDGDGLGAAAVAGAAALLAEVDGVLGKKK